MWDVPRHDLRRIRRAWDGAVAAGTPAALPGVVPMDRDGDHGGGAMARWRPLPQELSPQARLLVERLRVLKDRLDLSLAALAAKTAYSKSSWERFLNGRKPPTRQAVLSIAELAGADSARLLALWELADRSWLAEPDAAGAAGAVKTDDAVRTEDAAAPGAVPEGEERSAGGGDGAAPLASVPSVPPGPSVTAEPPGPSKTSGPSESSEPSGAAAVLPARARRRRRLLVVGAAVLAGAAVLVPGGMWSAGAFQGERGPSCVGEDCRGADAVAQDCARGAERVSVARYQGMRVTLWHSARCRAVWGELDKADGEAQVEVADSDDAMTSPPGGEGEVRTPMLGARTPHRFSACVSLDEAQMCAKGDGSHMVDEYELGDMGEGWSGDPDPVETDVAELPDDVEPPIALYPDANARNAGVRRTPTPALGAVAVG